MRFETDTQRELRPVVVVGRGEVGEAFGQQIENTGAKVTYVDPRFSQETPWHQTSMPICEEGSLILGAIPAAAASLVAKDLIRQQAEVLYIDLSSAAPAVAEACAKQLSDTKVAYVDGTIMGSVTLSGAAAPIVLSGPNADQAAERMTALGFNVQALPDSVAGDATRLKLLRTLVTKGIEALSLEAFATARELGLDDALRHGLSDIGQGGFANLLDAMMASHQDHSARRLEEIEAAVAQAHAQGVLTPVNTAVIDVFRASTEKSDRATPKAAPRKGEN